MRTPRFLFLGSLLVAGLIPVHSVKADAKLIDFTYIARDTTTGEDSTERAFEYSFGDWGNGKVIQVRNKGLLVNYLGSNGGVGANKRLNLRGSARIQIEFIIGNRNAASSFSFGLEDADGTKQSFSIPLADKPVGRPISHVFAVDQPTSTDAPGKVAGLDVKKLKVWQLKGNFQTQPLEVLVSKVTGVK
jgi:hypothetical protein